MIDRILQSRIRPREVLESVESGKNRTDGERGGKDARTVVSDANLVLLAKIEWQSALQKFCHD
jgi:hypothetical protein